MAQILQQVHPRVALLVTVEDPAGQVAVVAAQGQWGVTPQRGQVTGRAPQLEMVGLGLSTTILAYPLCMQLEGVGAPTVLVVAYLELEAALEQVVLAQSLQALAPHLGLGAVAAHSHQELMASMELELLEQS